MYSLIAKQSPQRERGGLRNIIKLFLELCDAADPNTKKISRKTNLEKKNQDVRALPFSLFKQQKALIALGGWQSPIKWK